MDAIVSIYLFIFNVFSITTCVVIGNFYCISSSDLTRKKKPKNKYILYIKEKLGSSMFFLLLSRKIIKTRRSKQEYITRIYWIQKYLRTEELFSKDWCIFFFLLTRRYNRGYRNFISSLQLETSKRLCTPLLRIFYAAQSVRARRKGLGGWRD